MDVATIRPKSIIEHIRTGAKYQVVGFDKQGREKHAIVVTTSSELPVAIVIHNPNDYRIVRARTVMKMITDQAYNKFTRKYVQVRRIEGGEHRTFYGRVERILSVVHTGRLRYRAFVEILCEDSQQLEIVATSEIIMIQDNKTSTEKIYTHGLDFIALG